MNRSQGCSICKFYIYVRESDSWQQQIGALDRRLVAYVRILDTYESKRSFVLSWPLVPRNLSDQSDIDQPCGKANLYSAESGANYLVLHSSSLLPYAISSTEPSLNADNRPIVGGHEMREKVVNQTVTLLALRTRITPIVGTSARPLTRLVAQHCGAVALGAECRSGRSRLVRLPNRLDYVDSRLGRAVSRHDLQP